MKVLARGGYNINTDDIEIFLVGAQFDHSAGRLKRFVVKPLEFDESAEGIAHRDPTFCMDSADAQALMSSLWDSGVRPAHIKSADGQTKHLEDMRAIAFAKLGVEKPC